jgi:dTDP-glucose pyrophosphorylase
MNVKIHYRITHERAGTAQAFTGTRHFVVREGEPVEETAMN